MIPYYIYQDGVRSAAYLQTLLGLMRQFPMVPVIVIINPADGPGKLANARYVELVDEVRRAGGTVVGYVSTAYLARPKRQVVGDIRRWAALYPQVDGIFLDEMTWETGPGNVGHAYVLQYRHYLQLAYKAGFYPVVANPGANQQPAYFTTKTADIICCHERDVYPPQADGRTFEAGCPLDLRAGSRCALVYAQSALDVDRLRRMIDWARWVYVTQAEYTDYGQGPVLNPWDTLSEHLAGLFKALAQVSQSRRPIPVASRSERSARKQQRGEVGSSYSLAASTRGSITLV